MSPEDYQEFLKSVDWSNPRDVYQAQSIAGEDVTLRNLFEQANPPKRNLHSFDDFYVDNEYGFDDY